MVEFVDVKKDAERELEKIRELEREGKVEEFKEGLKKLIEKDPYYLEPYVILSDVYEMEGRLKDAEYLLREAYLRAKELISKKGNLPDRLEWRHLTNRHIIKALINWGIFLWELGEVEEALKVLKEVYEMNPQDEPGVRYYILAILEGMSFDEFEQVFTKDGEYNREDLEHWFEKHSKEHPDLFNPSR